MMYCNGNGPAPQPPAAASAAPAPQKASLMWPLLFLGGLFALSAFGPPAVKRYAYYQRNKRLF